MTANRSGFINFGAPDWTRTSGLPGRSSQTHNVKRRCKAVFRRLCTNKKTYIKSPRSLFKTGSAGFCVSSGQMVVTVVNFACNVTEYIGILQDSVSDIFKKSLAPTWNYAFMGYCYISIIVCESKNHYSNWYPPINTSLLNLLYKRCFFAVARC